MMKKIDMIFFADTYKEASNILVELHKQKYVRTEQRKITESDDVSTVMNSPLSYEELTSALSNLKLKKSLDQMLLPMR